MTVYSVKPNWVEFEEEDGEFYALATFWNRDTGDMLTLARDPDEEDCKGVSICIGNQEYEHTTFDVTARLTANGLRVEFPTSSGQLGGYTEARIEFKTTDECRATLKRLFRGMQLHLDDA